MGRPRRSAPDVRERALRMVSSHPDQLARFTELLPAGDQERFDFNPQGIDVAAVAAQVGAASPLGNIPLVVVTRGQPEPFRPDAPVELTVQIEELWQALQSELLDLSTKSVQVTAENSGHNVPVEQPDTIVEAVRLVVEHLQSPDIPLENP